MRSHLNRASLCVLLSLLAAPALATPPAPSLATARSPRAVPAASSAVLTWSQLRGGIAPAPTVTSPYHVRIAPGVAADPFWGPGGLWPRAFAAPLLPGAAARRGAAAWDPASHSFFAMFAGLLVRVDRDARSNAGRAVGGETLVALLAGVAGHDLDVRAAAGIAVSREPDDTIVLHRFAGGLPGRRVLLRGPGYFEPRLSPDGRRVLVSQSHADGGRMIVIDLRSGQRPDLVRDIGQGYGPTWHPAGDRIIFSVITGRSQAITSAELWLQRLDTGERVALTNTSGVAEVEPAISPDGHFVAYADARTGRLLVAAMPRPSRGGAR